MPLNEVYETRRQFLRMKKPLSIYIHIPFCRSKCLYCDFVSFSGFQADTIQTYLLALKQEMQIFKTGYHDVLKSYEIDTLFIGGGTPTALSEESFAQLLKITDEAFASEYSPHIEYTVEANPKTITKYKADALQHYGINRVSLGLQSSNPQELRTIGRTHRFDDAKQSVEILQRHQIQNINLDLMYCLPGQTLSSFERSIEDALSLSPSHLSAYSLILEEGTALHRMHQKGQILLPSEEEDLSMYDRLIHLLKARDYHQYEISNYARSSMQCRHNINYWTCGEYLAFGLSAHAHFQGVRSANTSDLTAYITQIHQAKLPIQEKETISKEMAFEERIFLGLRMNCGLSIPKLNRDFDMDFIGRYDKILQKLAGDGLLIYDEAHLQLTQRGFELSNYVFREILG